jgi:hypothetical protein
MKNEINENKALSQTSVMQSVFKIPLEQQVENAILNDGGVLKGASNEIIVIAKIFAIEFALWKETIMQDDNGMYFSESRAQISRKNPVDINGLLEVFERVRSETVA